MTVRTGAGQIVARVADVVITTAELEARLDAIYRGPLASRLPARRSPDGARIRRWAAQLLISEATVVVEARRFGVAVPPRPKSVPEGQPIAANGADPASERAVRTAVAGLFEAVTAEVTVPEDELRRYYDANPDLWSRAGSAGPVPFESARAAITDDLLSAARGQAFDDWLLRRRAEIVTISAGYEHPGDPSLPDFVHRH